MRMQPPMRLPSFLEVENTNWFHRDVRRLNVMARFLVHTVQSTVMVSLSSVKILQNYPRRVKSVRSVGHNPRPAHLHSIHPVHSIHTIHPNHLTHNTHNNQIARMTSLPIGEGIPHHSTSKLWRLGFNEQKHFSGQSFQVWI